VLLRTNAIPVSGITENLYFVFAEIIGDNDGYKRYDYLPDRLAFSNSPPPVPTPAITSVKPSNLPGLPLPQTQELTITGTGFLPKSKLEFFDGTTTYPNRVPTTSAPPNSATTSKSAMSRPLDGESFQRSLGQSRFVQRTARERHRAARALGVPAFTGSVNDDFYYVTDQSGRRLGLAKVWKPGSPPTSPTDGVGFGLPDLKPLPVSRSPRIRRRFTSGWRTARQQGPQQPRVHSALPDTGAPLWYTAKDRRSVRSERGFSVVAGARNRSTTGNSGMTDLRARTRAVTHPAGDAGRFSAHSA
jgi:hypothetical protein